MDKIIVCILWNAVSFMISDSVILKIINLLCCLMKAQENCDFSEKNFYRDKYHETSNELELQIQAKIDYRDELEELKHTNIYSVFEEGE